MIDRNHALPIARQAELVGISRGNVYYLPRATSEADQQLMKRIDAISLAHPFAGSHMLRDMLNREGFAVGRWHVATLMQRMGIEALYRKPNTSKKHPTHKLYPRGGSACPNTEVASISGALRVWDRCRVVHGGGRASSRLGVFSGTATQRRDWKNYGHDFYQGRGSDHAKELHGLSPPRRDRADVIAQLQGSPPLGESHPRSCHLAQNAAVAG